MLNHTDYYKFTMGQLLWKQYAGTTVQWTFKDRSGTLRMPHGLREELDGIRECGFAPDEITYLRAWGLNPGYVDYLLTHSLPPVRIDGNQISTWGDAPLVSLWETIILAKVNERLHAGKANPFVDGRARLNEKIAVLQANPQIKFAEFGTRRRFSYEWQRHVLEQLMQHCPQSLTGTSNVGLAKEFGITPVGSHAHELPMIYAAFAQLDGKDPRERVMQFYEDWYNEYGPQIVLTDTFGSDHFFADYKTPERIRGLRHDSGDPYMFAQRAVKWFESFGVDPKTKTILFSDGLDLELMLHLHKSASPYIDVRFGWGTNLTCDISGVQPTNIVMKATGVMEMGKYAECVKLSDSYGKYTGGPSTVERYKRIFAA